jgi:hypothetical protein
MMRDLELNAEERQEIAPRREEGTTAESKQLEIAVAASRNRREAAKANRPF